MLGVLCPEQKTWNPKSLGDSSCWGLTEDVPNQDPAVTAAGPLSSHPNRPNSPDPPPDAVHPGPKARGPCAPREMPVGLHLDNLTRRHFPVTGTPGTGCRRPGATGEPNCWRVWMATICPLLALGPEAMPALQACPAGSESASEPTRRGQPPAFLKAPCGTATRVLGTQPVCRAQSQVFALLNMCSHRPNSTERNPEVREVSWHRDPAGGTSASLQEPYGKQRGDRSPRPESAAARGLQCSLGVCLSGHSEITSVQMKGSTDSSPKRDTHKSTPSYKTATSPACPVCI